jgi:hypothetical protein
VRDGWAELPIRARLHFTPRFRHFVAFRHAGKLAFVTFFPSPHITQEAATTLAHHRSLDMKKSFIGMAAIVLGNLASLSAQADTGQASVAVTAARQTYTPAAGEFSAFAHGYALANGQVAQFTQRGNHYYVQLKSAYRALHREDATGQKFLSTRLRPAGPGAFVTDDGAELTFRDDGEELRISGFERLPDARVAASERNVLMIARR